MTFTYYPIQKQWRKLRPVFEQPSIIRLAHQEMEAYALGRADTAMRLVKPRSANDRQQLGDAYVVDFSTNAVVASNCDLDDLAAELGIKA